MTRSESNNLNATWPPRRIAACVVLYHPPDAAFELVGILAEQFDEVFVVENESSRYRPPDPRIKLTRNVENLGLSGAINQLCEAARGSGHEWLILFDQDSRVPADFLAGFRKSLHDLQGPPGLLAANYETEILGQRLVGYTASADRSVTELTVALNSGSMVNLPVHAELGGHDEAFFVDHVDHDYCLRLAQNGYSVLGTSAPLFRHEVGNIVCAKMFGRVWQSSGHPAERRREWALGLVRLAKRYWRLSPGWILARLCVELPRNLLAMLLLESRKAAKLKAVLAGLWCGVFTSGSVR